MAQLLTSIATFFHIKKATTKLYCDNNEAIRYHPLNRATYTTMTKQDMDLKMEMDQILQTSPVTFQFCEVEGHADDSNNVVYKDAPQQVQCNIDMDSQAKSLLKNIKS